MYHSHWGLRESPFRNTHSPELFYQSPTHEEALARLHFLVEQRRRMGLLMGPAGSGKSFLLEVFANELQRRGHAVARLGLAGLGPAEMLGTLGDGLEINLDPSASLAALWRGVTDRLAEYRYQQLAAILLLDDADVASRPTLAVVARLAEHDLSPASRITLVLSGQQDRMGHLGEKLLSLAELRIDVEPWDQSDTEQFLATTLAQAGRREPVFDEPAIARLHELAHGIPRRVSQLADLALLAGAGRELRQIDSEVIESAYHELGVVEV